jgi:hypothetical protein
MAMVIQSTLSVVSSAARDPEKIPLLPAGGGCGY